MRNTLLLLVLSALVASASAHSLYAEFPEKLTAGSEAEIWIAYGHGGTADSELLSLALARLIEPGGEKIDLELEPYQGGLLGRAAIGGPGCYILDLQAEPTFFDPSWFGAAGRRSLVEKYARSLMPVESGQGFGWSKGDGLEIVPETDPYLLRSGDELDALALWNGMPVAGSYSAVVTRSPEDVLMVQHSQEVELEGRTEDGSLSFLLTRPGLWVLSFEATLDETRSWKAAADDPKGNYKAGDELEYDQIAPTAYLTFWVGR